MTRFQWDEVPVVLLAVDDRKLQRLIIMCPCVKNIALQYIGLQNRRDEQLFSVEATDGVYFVFVYLLKQESERSLLRYLIKLIALK
jgi:hypothetical protein